MAILARFLPGMRLSTIGWRVPLVLVGAFAVIALLTTVSYCGHLLTLFFIYLLLAEALDIIIGRAGLLVFCQAALCGTGAYAFALSRIRPDESTSGVGGLLWTGGWNFMTCLVCGLLIGMAAGAFWGYLCRRIRGDSLVFVTLGIQVAFLELLLNADAIGNGVTGLHGIGRPVVGGLPVNSAEGFALIAAPLAFVGVVAVRRLKESGFGLALACMNDDEVAVRAIGINTSSIVISAFAVCGAVSGLAGALYAGYMRFIEPGSFSLDFGIAVFAALLLIGPGARHAPTLCAVLLVGLPEVLRLIGLPSAQAANVRGILYGATMIILILRRTLHAQRNQTKPQ